MATREKQAQGTPAAAEKSPPARPGRKRAIAIGGSLASAVALAFLAALLAVPNDRARRELDGPFVGPLTAEKVQVNLSDGRSFLVLQLNVLYEAYARAYFMERAQDPVCNAEVRDALVALASSRSREQVVSEADKPVFAEEVRHAVEPLIFPVHFGEAREPHERDPRSGLAPGRSRTQATFRGLIREHALAVDAVGRTLRLDGGPIATFRGDERDLEVLAPDGSSIYVDVAALDPSFSGDVAVGVHGRIQRILWSEILIQ